MKWEKMGLVFAPDRNHSWMASHASLPLAEHVADDLFRVYFSSRDERQRSHVAFVEIDLKRPREILRVSDRPVVSPGPPGAFDDSGASLGCLVSAQGSKYLYYVGWNLGITVPWRNSIGLAIGDSESLEFKKRSEAPVLDRNATDPYSLSYPWITREDGIWKMWYGSNLRWGTAASDMAHVIKYASSQDGVYWERPGTVAVDLKSPGEYALCRPCVLREGGLYRMWYSYRGQAAYRIGYAESSDGLRWTRKDEEAGIGPSEGGWDGAMVEYPYVFDHRGRRYMLYNGDGYGKTGFGLAVLAGPNDSH